jgi:hypothetical protein
MSPIVDGDIQSGSNHNNIYMAIFKINCSTCLIQEGNLTKILKKWKCKDIILKN